MQIDLEHGSICRLMRGARDAPPDGERRLLLDPAVSPPLTIPSQPSSQLNLINVASSCPETLLTARDHTAGSRRARRTAAPVRDRSQTRDFRSSPSSPPSSVAVSPSLSPYPPLSFLLLPLLPGYRRSFILINLPLVSRERRHALTKLKRLFNTAVRRPV